MAEGTMTMEQQYMIAMIALAGACGALIIAFIITCCCCMRYQRKLYGGQGTPFGKHTVRQQEVQWPVTACDSWGATPYGSTDGYQGGGGGGCHRNSAYDWALPQANPYGMSPRPQIKSGNDYGKVLLNPPSAVCTSAAMPSTKLAGHCGPGGGCDGKFYQSSGQPLGNSAAQFVLDSGATKYQV